MQFHIMNRLKYFITSVTLLFALSSYQTLAQDLTAPSWSLKDGHGNTVSSEQFAGEPLVVHFWATWCPYCKKLQPGLERLKQQYQDEGVAFIAISFREDEGTDPQAVLDARGISIPTLIEGDSVAFDKFGVSGTPTTFFIDHTGQVLGVTRTSDPDDPILEQAVPKLLDTNQKPAVN